jgi:hypothetical protein
MTREEITETSVLLFDRIKFTDHSLLVRIIQNFIHTKSLPNADEYMAHVIVGSIYATVTELKG